MVTQCHIIWAHLYGCLWGRFSFQSLFQRLQYGLQFGQGLTLLCIYCIRQYTVVYLEFTKRRKIMVFCAISMWSSDIRVCGIFTKPLECKLHRILMNGLIVHLFIILIIINTHCMFTWVSWFVVFHFHVVRSASFLTTFLIQAKSFKSLHPCDGFTDDNEFHCQLCTGSCTVWITEGCLWLSMFPVIYNLQMLKKLFWYLQHVMPLLQNVVQRLV